MAGSFGLRAATESGREGLPAPTRRALAIAVESLLAVGLTLGCFSGFLVMLDVVFPEGQALHSMLGRAPVAERPATELAPVVATLAELEVMKRAVRSRPAGTIAWGPVSTGHELRSGDGVQTGPVGRAQIAFGENARVWLERNSMVVLSDPREDATRAAGAPEPRARRVIMSEGEMWARMRAGAQEAIEITLPNATASLSPSAAPTTEMQVKLRQGGRAALAVRDGHVGIRGAGGAMDVGPRQYVMVAGDGTLSAPLPLPDAPVLQEPANSEVFAYLDLPPQVPFRWRALDGIQAYRVRVARDPGFKDVVLDETVTETSLTWGRLQPGTYHWQVTAYVDDVDGMPSATRMLVVQRGGDLQLDVATPVVQKLRCKIRGRVSPRANVFVDGQRVEVGRSGSFAAEIDLQPGANMVLVEAVDAAGHSTYWSRVVHGKP